MDYEWDENKRLETLKVRGLDFRRAVKIFDGFTIEWDSPKNDEQRIAAVGMVDKDYITVIYTWRDGRRRIICVRPARRQERQRHEQARAHHEGKAD